MLEKIGKTIARMRREKQITQEDLAKYAGVSAQAVSKWENGGVPDIELLPVIADFFGVSIDSIFGRNVTACCDAENAIAKKIDNAKPQKRFDIIFDLCWAMERSLMDPELTKGGSIAEIRADLSDGARRYSSVIDDSGFTLMGLDGVLPYCFIAPECSDKRKGYFEGVDYVELFEDLSDRKFFDALIFLNQRNCEKGFTNELLIDNLEIVPDEAVRIIKLLRKYRLLNVTEVELKGKTETIYTFRRNPAIPALLIIAREIIERPNSYTYYCMNRTKPFFD